MVPRVTAPDPAHAPRAAPPEDWGVAAGGYAVMAVAALVMVGWILRVDIFVVALPGLAPMVFNTALCLLALGLATVLIGLGRGRHPAAVASACFAGGLAAAGLAETASGRDLGVADFFHPGDLPSIEASPGRIGPNTALVLLSLAAAALLVSRGGVIALRSASACAAFAGALGLAALAGYAGRYPAAYQWSASAAGMATHTAAVALLLAALLLVVARRGLRRDSRVATWALALCAAGFLLLTVGWIAYRSLDQVARADASIARTLQAEDRLRQARLALTGLEAAQLAWSLTRDPAHERVAKEEAVRLRTALDELRALAADESQVLRLARLVQLVGERTRALEVPAPAGDASRAEKTLALTAELDGVLRRMETAEREALDGALARASRAVAEARGVVTLGLSLALLFGLGAVFLLRRALGALRDSRGRLASIVSALDEGLVLHGRDGAILECNAAAVRVLGLTAAQLAGRHSLDVRWRAIHEDGSPYPGDTHPAMVALRSGEPQRDRLMGVQRADGSLVWITINAEPVRDAEGRVTSVVSSFFDVTARRAAELALRESEERFRKTFDHAGIGMGIVGLDGRWLRVNRALLEILGYSEAELLARTFRDVAHPDDIDGDLRELRRLVDGHVSHYQHEKRYLHRAGRVVWIRLTGALVRDGGGAPVHFVMQIEDVTDRKQAAERLAAYADRLAEKNRELQDFAHVASHDLQEPLRKIQAFGDRLDQRAGPRLEPEERDYVARMRAAAARMSALIDALLAYSRVGSQPRAFAPVSLDRVLREALQDLEFRLERTGGKVEAGPLPEVSGDAVQLRQLFQNLVGNALKYHRPEAPPLVRVSAAPAPDGALRASGPAWEIRVEDNGIGFEPRHAEAIFGVFHRLHPRDRYEGAGVGLAICRRIVERHRGAVRAEGRPGEGSVFTVVLPVAPPADALDA